MANYMQAPAGTTGTVVASSGTSYTIANGIVDVTSASGADVKALTAMGFTPYSPPALSALLTPSPLSDLSAIGSQLAVSPTESVLGSGSKSPVQGSTGSATTTDGSTQVTIFSFTPPANSGDDWVVSLIGLDVTSAPPVSGDFYRGDLQFSTTRVGTAAPTLFPSSPAASNTQNSGGGSGYAVQAVISGNAILVQVKGATNKTVHWSGTAQRTQVS